MPGIPRSFWLFFVFGDAVGAACELAAVRIGAGAERVFFTE